jgi:hypothetical protein
MARCADHGLPSGGSAAVIRFTQEDWTRCRQRAPEPVRQPRQEPKLLIRGQGS